MYDDDLPPPTLGDDNHGCGCLILICMFALICALVTVGLHIHSAAPLS